MALTALRRRSAGRRTLVICHGTDLRNIGSAFLRVHHSFVGQSTPRSVMQRNNSAVQHAHDAARVQQQSLTTAYAYVRVRLEEVPVVPKQRLLLLGRAVQRVLRAHLPADSAVQQGTAYCNPT